MKEIGGFFEWELNQGAAYHPDAIELNSARNCLAYMIRAQGIKKLKVPAYTCPLLWDTLQAEHCEIEFYQIGTDFYPRRSFAQMIMFCIQTTLAYVRAKWNTWLRTTNI